MKRNIFLLVLLLGTVSVYAQKHPTKKKKAKDDFSVVVKDSEKDKIDWNGIKEYFHDKKATDSVQISVKITDREYKNLKSETKYTFKGPYQNINEIVENLKKMIAD